MWLVLASFMVVFDEPSENHAVPIVPPYARGEIFETKAACQEWLASKFVATDELNGFQMEKKSDGTLIFTSTITFSQFNQVSLVRCVNAGKED